MENDGNGQLRESYWFNDALDLDDDYTEMFGKGFFVMCVDCNYDKLYRLAKKAMERGYPLSDEEIGSTVVPDFPQPDEIKKRLCPRNDGAEQMSEAGRIAKDVARGVVKGTLDSLPHLSTAVNQVKKFYI